MKAMLALGGGIEKWNCHEYGMTWHAKIYLGLWILLIRPNIEKKIDQTGNANEKGTK